MRILFQGKRQSELSWSLPASRPFTMSEADLKKAVEYIAKGKIIIILFLK